MTVPIGNDVVDLRDPESAPAALHPRFDGRVFDAAEIDLLARSASPALLRWTLWAAKEAAYKAARQLDARVVFSPRRFVVSRLGGSLARVDGAERSFAVRFEQTADYVHAIATVLPVEAFARRGRPGSGESLAGPRRADRLVLLRPLSGVASLGTRSAAGAGSGPSEAARDLLLDALAPRLGMPRGRLEVVRRGRVPSVVHRGRVLDLAVSLSHHGRFAAFACLPPRRGNAEEAV